MKSVIDVVKQKNIEVTIECVRQEINEKYIMEDLRLKASENEVKVFFLYPGENGVFPAVHFIHWLETHATDSNRTQFLPIAREFAELGVISILPDCFWSVDYDKYKNDPEYYHSKWWKTQTEDDLELIKQQLIELKMVEKYLLTHELVDQERVVMGSHDFGAMFGCLLSSLGYKYRAYAFLAMTGKFSDWFRFGSKKTEEELKPYGQDLDYLAPINHIGQLSPSPVHLGFATNDFYVLVNIAKMIFANTNEPKELKWYDCGHEMTPQAFMDFKEWLLTHLN